MKKNDLIFLCDIERVNRDLTMQSSEGFFDLFKKTTKNITNIENLFSIKYILFHVIDKPKFNFSFKSGKFCFNSVNDSNKLFGPINVPSKPFSITSVKIKPSKSQSYNLAAVKFSFFNKIKPQEFKLINTFSNIKSDIILYDCNENDYKLLKNKDKNTINEVEEGYYDMIEYAGDDTLIDTFTVKSLNSKDVLCLGFVEMKNFYIIGGYTNNELVSLYFSIFKLDTYNEIIANPDKNKIMDLFHKGES